MHVNFTFCFGVDIGYINRAITSIFSSCTCTTLGSIGHRYKIYSKNIAYGPASDVQGVALQKCGISAIIRATYFSLLSRSRFLLLCGNCTKIKLSPFCSLRLVLASLTLYVAFILTLCDRSSSTLKPVRWSLFSYFKAVVLRLSQIFDSWDIIKKIFNMDFLINAIPSCLDLDPGDINLWLVNRSSG
jgi:hypothetical protein